MYMWTFGIGNIFDEFNGQEHVKTSYFCYLNLILRYLSKGMYRGSDLDYFEIPVFQLEFWSDAKN